jgi:drug/metabolite transporter (DMT)-like permease
MSVPAKETTPLAASDATAKTSSSATKKGSSLTVFVSCSFFIACSCSMLPVNKIVVRAFAEQAISVVGVQMALAALSVSPFPETFRWGNTHDVIRWSTTIPWFFVGMLMTSMLGLKYNSLGATTVVRNASPFVMIPLERVINNEPQLFDWQVIAALGTTLTGVVLYMLEDVEFSLIGVFLIVLNTVLAICDRVFQRRLIAAKPVDIPKLGMVFLNNAVGLVPLIPTAILFGDPWTYSRMPLDYASWSLLVSSAMLGTIMGWSSINAQQYVSATAHMVMTNINKFLVIGFGIAFRNESRTMGAIIGCTMAILGGCWFAIAKATLSSRLKDREAKADAADAEEGKLRGSA